MKKRNFDLSRHLLRLAEQLPEGKDTPTRGRVSRVLRENATSLQLVRANLSDYRLQNLDILLVAMLFEKFLENDSKVQAVDLANRLHSDTGKILNTLLRIRTLVGNQVFDLRDVDERANANPFIVENPNRRFTLVHLVRSTLVFQEAFLQRIFAEPGIYVGREDLPYADNREYLEGWFAFIAALSDYRGQRQIWADDLTDFSENLAKVREAKRVHEKRLELTEIRFPFQELVDEERLDTEEQQVMLYLLREEINDRDCSVRELIEFLSEDRFEHYKSHAYFEPQSKLISRGLIELQDGGFLAMKRSTEIRLAPDISRRILSRKPQNDEEQLHVILRSEEMLTVVNPMRSLDTVILPGDLKHKLETAVKRYHARVDAKLRHWGIDHDPSGLRVGEHDEAPLLLLFSGPSGTGKTLSAEALAHRLGRKMLVTDVSKLLGMFVGESEKSVSRLFYLFDKIVRRCETPPILLLNECDQFLGKREMSRNTSSDRMYHQMQNLFLEGFERMRGIMIATTNLADSMDPAFSRRFHMKLEFPEPGYEERLALWALYLDNDAPKSKDIDAEIIARQYRLTGGQIMVIVRNAAIQAATEGRAIDQAMLLDFAIREQEGSSMLNSGRLRAPIGFQN